MGSLARGVGVVLLERAIATVGQFGASRAQFDANVLVRDTAEVDAWLAGKPLPRLVQERCVMMATGNGAPVCARLADRWYAGLYYATANEVVYLAALN